MSGSVNSNFNVGLIETAVFNFSYLSIVDLVELKGQLLENLNPPTTASDRNVGADKSMKMLS